MRHLLVTGGAGFIGSHLCERLLSLGFHVTVLDNFNSSYDPLLKRKNFAKARQDPHCELIEGDIRDRGLLERIVKDSKTEAVIHLAALAGVRRSLENPLEYVDVDIGGTLNLLEVCKKYGIGKFVFASSSSVYGLNPCPFKESAPLGVQTSPYAAAKLSGESFCRTYNHLYGISTVCLRFFTVYGPRQRPDMTIRKFIESIREGREVSIFGNGSSSRDYTFIDDIVDGIIAAIDLKCGFEAINLGNSSPVGILELVATIEKALEKKAQIVFMPDQPGDVPATFADIRKARRLLGYKPKVGLAEGIKMYIDTL